MMKSSASLVVVAMILTACAEHIHYGANPNAQYYLSNARLALAEREALDGDNEAAKRVADYYYFAKNDRTSCMWWLVLAAKRGDPVAQENLKRLQQE
jgi:hypothetical protein